MPNQMRCERSEPATSDVNYNVLASHSSNAKPPRSVPFSDTVVLGVDRAKARVSMSPSNSDTVGMNV